MANIIVANRDRQQLIGIRRVIEAIMISSGTDVFITTIATALFVKKTEEFLKGKQEIILLHGFVESNIIGVGERLAYVLWEKTGIETILMPSECFFVSGGKSSNAYCAAIYAPDEDRVIAIAEKIVSDKPGLANSLDVEIHIGQVDNYASIQEEPHYIKIVDSDSILIDEICGKLISGGFDEREISFKKNFAFVPFS